MPAHNKPIGPLTMNEVLRMSIEQMAGNGSSRRSRQMEEVLRRTEEMQASLERCEQLFRYALPKFNWGASALDAEAITLLNEVPGEVKHALHEAWTPINNRPACNI